MSLREYIRQLILESKECKSPKIIFMAGGPGSGKSHVIRSLGLKQKMRVINPDDQYEASMKAECIPMDRESVMDEYMPIRSEYKAAEQSGDTETMSRLEPDYERLRSTLSRDMTLFNQARAQAKKDREACCLNKEDYVVDGTGGSLRDIKQQVVNAKESGYDVAMIYVHVPLKESQRRNRERSKLKTPGRTLTPRTVKRSWSAVDRNRLEYEKMFKSNFFLVINTEEESETSINSIRSRVGRFLES
jgi:predicted ABC-type ATPase